MNHAEIALAAHDEHFNCSQSVFSAFAPELGMDRDLALKVATSFGGGMGRQAETCGAVTGAYLALGLKYGMVNGGDLAAKEKSYAMVQEFARRFRARCGALDCRDLLGVDISAPGGFQLAQERQLTATRCPLFIRTAAEILDEML
jgi:C_GCAxxG_C_C family probable redox protein